MSAGQPWSVSIGVAEAKRRFSELTDRVGRGESIVVTRRGRPAVALVRPELATDFERGQTPTGLVAAAGALSHWESLERDMQEVVTARRRARDRPAPDLG